MSAPKLDGPAIEAKLQEVLDYIRKTYYQADGVRMEIGIWDSAEEPITYYAVLRDRKDHIILGETSYGSVSIERALDDLLRELDDPTETDAPPHTL